MDNSNKICSNIQIIARSVGIQNPQDLSHELKMSWATAKLLWDGNIKKTQFVTMVKVAALFECKIDDLFKTI